MRDGKQNYVIVGGFVIAMVAALILWIALVTGRTGATDDYYVVFEDVSGLKPGLEILFQGYRFGLIDAVEPMEDRPGFRVDVSVRRGWPIPEDSEAVVETGLFSAAIINVKAGESERLLAPGSRIPSSEGGGPLAAVGGLASELQETVRDRINPMIEKVENDIPTIVKNIEEVTSEMRTTVVQINKVLERQNVERVGSILANMDKATSDVNTVIADLSASRQGIDSVIQKLDALLEEDQGDLAVAIADLRYSLATMSRHIDAIGANLETTTRNLNEFSRQVRDNPGVLVTGRETSDDGL
ncbi:MAG: MlaD family protein [Myxococcota bacterium]|nr:MlaD family protein [Myxococcota bacterium]